MSHNQQATAEPLLELGHADRLPTSGYSAAELVMSVRSVRALDDVQTRRRPPHERQPAA